MYPPMEASPTPFFGRRDESGPERIALDVPHDRQQVSIVLNRKCLEAVGPDPARRTPLAMVSQRMLREQLLEPPRHVIVRARPGDHVKVIGHQADGGDAQGLSFLEAARQSDEQIEIIGLEEDGAAIIAPIQDVVVEAGTDVSGTPWHAGTITASRCTGIPTTSTVPGDSRYPGTCPAQWENWGLSPITAW